MGRRPCSKNIKSIDKITTENVKNETNLTDNNVDTDPNLIKPIYDSSFLIPTQQTKMDFLLLASDVKIDNLSL